MKQEEIQVNGLKTAFIRRKAENAKTTIIFVHGFPFAKEMWLGQLESLPEDVNAIAYDIRGFGDSEPGQRFYTIDLFSDDLLALIKALGLERCVVCGISMGGYIALRGYEKDSSAFAGLVLCDTTSLADTNESKLARFKGIETILAEGPAAYAEDFVKKVFLESTFEDDPGVIERIRTMISNTDPSTLCSALLALASRTDTSGVLGRVEVPTLVLRGESDKIIGHDHALGLHMGIRNSVQSTIAAAAHLPNLEQPAKFNECLTDFLTRF